VCAAGWILRAGRGTTLADHAALCGIEGFPIFLVSSLEGKISSKSQRTQVTPAFGGPFIISSFRFHSLSLLTATGKRGFIVHVHVHVGRSEVSLGQ
jgi:hypothetical protein